MQVFHKIQEIRDFLKVQRTEGKSIGFVPTMGALHLGHLSLVERAKQECDVKVMSIFVNPTQFNQSEDFRLYPRTIEKDLELLNNSTNVDAVFLPSHEELYADAYRYRVYENKESLFLCGAHRPGHFEGVLTIVLKLLQIIKADKAYFGEKDFQQLQLIKGMVRAFFLETEIISCPTVRELDGLAMSSRNIRLDKSQRTLAEKFPKILNSSQNKEEMIRQLELAGFVVDYVEDWYGHRLAAVWLGEVRLIDNIELQDSEENVQGAIL